MYNVKKAWILFVIGHIEVETILFFVKHLSFKNTDLRAITVLFCDYILMFYVIIVGEALYFLNSVTVEQDLIVLGGSWH